MARGRERRPVGKYGKITTKGTKATKETKGKWVARCWFRDFDGIARYVTAQGTTEDKAIDALKTKVEERQVVYGAEITPKTHVRILAETWFASLDQSQATKDTYRGTLDNHILGPLGHLQIREATTAHLDAFLRTVAVKGPSAAKQCKVVLSLMFGMASRYDAVPANPVTDTKLQKSDKTAVVALSVDEVMELRADIHAWAAEKASRAATVDMVDLFLSTGLRPGELLAVRYEDVDLKARTLRVTGTVKRDSVNGLHRQAKPKTDSGFRTLTLTDFAVSMIRRRRLAGTSSLLFPNRNGGPLEPANFRRVWRAARGEKWAHVEPRAFRRAVATLIDRESGSLAASQQLGHSSDSITKAHYIQRNDVAPDHTSVLGKFRAAE